MHRSAIATLALAASSTTAAVHRPTTTSQPTSMELDTTELTTRLHAAVDGC